jgi:uncharacterized repeat protein (TIGR03803 family)
VHNFDSTDGIRPFAGVVQATNGDLHGTTAYQGANSYGTVYKISLTGALTTLHNFNSTDGAKPAAALLQAADGNLYGSTLSRRILQLWNGI